MEGPVVKYVKALLPPSQWRALRRGTGRLRWLRKFQLLRMYGHPILRRPMQSARYIFWDPEVESYTYEVANEAVAAEFLAPVLGVSESQVSAWFDEAKADAYLSRDRGFHWSCKRWLPLGNRTIWYAIARAIKPRVVIETGVHDGLGSEVLLSALKRNGQDGQPGRLISFDVFEDTGWLVHNDLRRDWRLIHGSTLAAMEPVLRDVEVDLFIHDTLHTEEVISTEFAIALRHAAQRLVVIDGSGLVQPTLRQFCQRLAGEHHCFCDLPLNHFVRPHGTGLAFFDRDKIAEQIRVHAAA